MNRTRPYAQAPGRDCRFDKGQTRAAGRGERGNITPGFLLREKRVAIGDACETVLAQVRFPAMKLGLVLCLVIPLCVTATAQSSNQLLIQDIHVTGTRSLDTSELNEIIGPLNQMKIRNGQGEIRDRIRFLFQEHGYLDAKVKTLSVRALDPLASIVPVSVDAEVENGVAYRLGDIHFVGNHALSADELRAEFPFRNGERFSRRIVAAGLEGLFGKYWTLGYLDAIFVPDTVKDSAGKVDLKVEVEEGHQYRMGELRLVGDDQLAKSLRPRWELESGKPFDKTYLKKFFDENRSMLPEGFSLENSVNVVEDCRQELVLVFVELGPTQEKAPKPIPCAAESKN